MENVLTIDSSTKYINPYYCVNKFHYYLQGYAHHLFLTITPLLYLVPCHYFPRLALGLQGVGNANSMSKHHASNTPPNTP